MEAAPTTADERCAPSVCLFWKIASIKDPHRKPSTASCRLRVTCTLADEEIIERLTQVRGIGRWTVEMMLMSRLGRPDVLPIDDFGVERISFIRFRGMPTPLCSPNWCALGALPVGGRRESVGAADLHCR